MHFCGSKRIPLNGLLKLSKYSNLFVRDGRHYIASSHLCPADNRHAIVASIAPLAPFFKLMSGAADQRPWNRGRHQKKGINKKTVSFTTC